MWKYAVVACGMLLAVGAAPGPIMAEDAVVMTIQVSPATINLAQKGTWVTVHADIAYDEVLDVKAVVELNGVAVAWTKADAQGNLVAKFNVDDIKEIVEVPSADVTLTGEAVTPDGVEYAFSGTGTVRVIDKGGKR